MAWFLSNSAGRRCHWLVSAIMMSVVRKKTTGPLMVLRGFLEITCLCKTCLRRRSSELGRGRVSIVHHEFMPKPHVIDGQRVSDLCHVVSRAGRLVFYSAGSRVMGWDSYGYCTQTWLRKAGCCRPGCSDLAHYNCTLDDCLLVALGTFVPLV